ncbi:hypothetical protein [Bradyrhizobium sp. STM 3557]|uniref:hypothetical protein n=1 Tax=Bradyrhizobium sp. STM 3557 TaxID=578920 RepID=UPI00388EBDE0
MLKKMSIALLAASILAAPALAAGSAKTTAPAKPAQTAASPMKSGEAKSAAVKSGEVKSTAGKRHLKKVVRHHRVKHRHYAHRHHNKVSAMQASAKSHAPAKTHKVGLNKIKKTGPKLSFKRVTPATRRG